MSSHTEEARPAQAPGAATEPHDDVEHAHPTDGKYIQIALILAAITAAEVATFYVEEQLGALLVPILMVMMVVKFAMVAMWFMHLKFDSRLFSRVFVAGAMGAASVYVIALATFQFFA